MGFTTNKNLEQVARGADVGTWDTPTNANWGIVDNSLGGVATVALTNSNVTLSANQYQCVFLNFTGSLSASVTITLPAVGSFYTVQNLTSNTSAFFLTMTTTVSGGQAIGIPPGEPVDILTDGTNVKFNNLGRVGTYWDYAGSSVPQWLSGCTVPPYLNCDGTSFSSAVYPILATILGTTVLPDSKGRTRFTLNQGSTRITSTAAGTGGIDGNTNYAGGGLQNLSSNNLPSFSGIAVQATATSTIGGNANILVSAGSFTTAQSGGGVANVPQNVTSTPSLFVTGSASYTGLAANYLPPGYVGGLTFVRAG